MTTIEEDEIMFQAQNKNREHIAEFGNAIYESREAITEARLHGDRVRFGIWREGRFIGTTSYTPSEDNQEAEIGTWLIKEATGQGNASSARRALSEYLAAI